MKIYAVVFILILTWVLGFSAYAVIDNNTFTFFSSVIGKKIYSPFCHQHSGKCFSINNHPFLVCARCTGIYTGSLLITFLFLLKRKIKISGGIVAASIIILLTDVLCTTLGVYNYSKSMAFATGIFSGIAVFSYILLSLEKYFAVNENI